MWVHPSHPDHPVSGSHQAAQPCPAGAQRCWWPCSHHQLLLLTFWFWEHSDMFHLAAGDHCNPMDVWDEKARFLC